MNPRFIVEVYTYTSSENLSKFVERIFRNDGDYGYLACNNSLSLSVSVDDVEGIMMVGVSQNVLSETIVKKSRLFK